MASTALIFIGCYSHSNTDQTDSQNKPRSTMSNDQQTNKPSWGQEPISRPLDKNTGTINKDTGPKVKITAHINSRSGDSEQDFFMPADTEKFEIWGFQLRIANIGGLEQLKNVRHLILIGVNYNDSDVFEAIKIFSNTLEKIVFVNCYISDSSITESFPKLKAIVYQVDNINSVPHFNFLSNNDLEYFYLYITVFYTIGDGDQFTRAKDILSYTPEMRENHSLEIDPSARMKFISIDSNYYPLIVTEKLCDKLSEY